MSLIIDGATKQNKGRFFFAFLAMLVHHSVFDKVLVSFLPVGHTHEDIDQMFSCFADYLRGHNARSRAEMADASHADLCFQVKVGSYYIVRPSDDDETQSPFWIAEVAKRGRPHFKFVSYEIVPFRLYVVPSVISA